MSDGPLEVVVVPWRAGPDAPALRRDPFCRVLLHLLDNGFHPLPSSAEPWSPGAARNNGVVYMLGPVFAFVDADTLVPPEQLRAAIRLAGEAPGLVYAYDLYLRRGFPGAGFERELVQPASMGAVAVSRETFEEVGGFPEWQGWGFEDLAFAEACAKVAPIRRVTGPVEHLWHGERRADDSPEDSELEQVAANRTRWELSHK